MKGIDRLCRRRAQTNMNATVGFDGRHVGAAIDPELRIFLAVTNSRIRPLAKLGESEWRQHRVIECVGGLNIAHSKRNMVDHGCRFPNYLTQVHPTSRA